VIPNEKQLSIIKQSNNGKFIPIPGCLPTNFQVLDNIDQPWKNLPHHQKLLQTSNEEIIDMIQELDGGMILEYLENLTAFGPRETGTIECQDAGEYIYNEFESMGLDVRYHNWSYSGYEDRNIEATIHGTDPTSDEIYIICGHYDSVLGSPGADDDGSGTAAVMTAAYIMSQYTFNHTIRFVAFSGEEQGLLGSHEYVAEAYANGDNIIATLNADMLGYAETEYEGNNVKIYEEESSEWVTDFMDDVGSQYYGYIKLDVIPSGWSWGSDHYYFWEYGYSAIFIHEYHFSPYWHTPEDTIENMNNSYLTKTSRLLLATLAELAQTWRISFPPDKPLIDGPSKGKPEIKYDYTFTAIDPDDDRIYYYVDWGDGNFSDWLGPYNSGEEITLPHMWMEEGTYKIKAKTKDTYNFKSNWSELNVNMPREKTINRPFLNFLENHPKLYQLLLRFLRL